MNNDILKLNKCCSILFYCVTVTKTVLKQLSKMMTSEETDSQSTVLSDAHPEEASGKCKTIKSFP